MQVIDVQSGQSALDISLQYYGAAEGLVRLIQDNQSDGWEFDAVFPAGQKLKIIQRPIRPEIVEFYKKFNHTPNSNYGSLSS
jgi:hypothetical protein